MDHKNYNKNYGPGPDLGKPNKRPHTTSRGPIHELGMHDQAEEQKT